LFNILFFGMGEGEGTNARESRVEVLVIFKRVREER
jgi:hypothetical protein